MRIKALTSDCSLRKSVPHKLYLGESRESAFVVVQQDKTIKYLRVPVSKFLGFDENALKALRQLPLKSRDQVNQAEAQKKVLVALDSESMD